MGAGSEFRPPVLSQDHLLIVFGPLRLLGPDGRDLTPPGRKARALLAILALAPDAAASRERLAGLLWASRGDEQARASLRQTLYEMRDLCAGDRPLLQVERARIGLDRGRVRTDLDGLQRLADADDVDGFVAALGDRPAEPLGDLSGSDPALDDWLSGERTRCGDLRRRLALAVGQRACSAGQANLAERIAEALLALDPLDEVAARLGFVAARARGDESRARQIHERLAAALRLELGAVPSAETEAAYRAPAIGPVTAMPPAPAVGAESAQANAAPIADFAAPTASATASDSEDEPAPASVPASPSRRTHAHRPLLAATLCGLALLVALVTLGLHLGDRDPRRVLWVQALAAPASDPSALALGKGFPGDLARMIVGNDANLEIAADEPDPAADRSGDDIAIAGTARAADGLLHAEVQIVARDDGVILWSRSFVRPQAELPALREQVAAKVADVAICALGGHNPSPQALGAEAMRLYLSACENKHDDWALSARVLHQLVQRRPEFAHAWAMLAAATTAAAYQRPHEAEALHREALGYASHALALDPHDGEAYYAQSETLPGLAHWRERMAILEAGHAAAPDNALVNGRIAFNLASVGRWREAIPYAQRAADEDPFSPAQAGTLATLLAFGAHPEEAQAVLERLRHRYSSLAFANRIELDLEGLAGDPRHALQLLDDPLRPLALPRGMPDLWRAFLAARIEPDAPHVASAVAALDAQLPTMMPWDLAPAEFLVALGRTRAAYDWADHLDPHAIDGRQTLRLFHAGMAPLRADPRFMDLARRYGLVDIWVASGHRPDFCQDHGAGDACHLPASAGPAN